MNTVEIEQLKNDLAVKVGILKMSDNNNEHTEIYELYEDYEKNGTTLEEMKLLYDDVLLALSE